MRESGSAEIDVRLFVRFAGCKRQDDRLLGGMQRLFKP
jgi:hypothetical protein